MKPNLAKLARPFGLLTALPTGIAVLASYRFGKQVNHQSPSQATGG